MFFVWKPKNVKKRIFSFEKICWKIFSGHVEFQFEIPAKKFRYQPKIISQNVQKFSEVTIYTKETNFLQVVLLNK